MKRVKALVRMVLATLLYNGWYRWLRSWDRSRNGRPLKDGITAVVSAKNEEYILPFCLRSLIGVVDQVVCIDNGSEDGTLAAMRDFERTYGDEIEVDVIEMPGALLGDCRNTGLEHTRYKWHLRWDADMVCRTSGPEDMRQLREQVLTNDRPRTVRLPRTNLRGDLHHTRKDLPPIDPGEPILVRFGTDIRYVEDGKFDVIRVPFYYAIESEKKRYYFHCEGLKPDSNLIYRRQYFEWREAFNRYREDDRPKEVEDFKCFSKNWNLKNFGTNDPKSLKWRFQREFCNRLSKVDPGLFGEYPDVLRTEAKEDDTRFLVKRINGRPYTRIDRKDPEMLGYRPTSEDMEWESKNVYE